MKVVEALFIYCIVWSCGAAVVQRPGSEDRDRFDKFVKSIAGMGTMDGERVSSTQLPAKSLYEYCFDVESMCWRSWRSFVTEYVPPTNGKFSKIVVPTADLVRSTSLAKTILSEGKPCLFVGESGTAKTVTIQNYLNSLNPVKNILLNMNFSSRTMSSDVQQAIEDSTEKRAKDTYGPPVGKKLLIYLDDLNMPKVDLYGTQQPIALLKLFIERGGFYDRGKELNWKKMRDITCVASMGPPGGARNNVDPRFISMFNVFEIQFPSHDNLRTIFQSVLLSHVAALSEDIRAASAMLTDITLATYSFITEKLPPTPSRFHYIFNLRDLSRLFEGLLRSTPDKFFTTPQFIRLWRNEVLRIFHDRLINEQDKQLVLEHMEEVIISKFAGVSESVLANPIIFGEFKHAASVIEDPEADVVRRLPEVQRRCLHCMLTYR
jgi:dynein heavy chain, axonemal